MARRIDLARKHGQNVENSDGLSELAVVSQTASFELHSNQTISTTQNFGYVDITQKIYDFSEEMKPSIYGCF